MRSMSPGMAVLRLGTGLLYLEAVAYTGCLTLPLEQSHVLPGAALQSQVVSAANLYPVTALDVSAYVGCVVAAGWVGSEAFGNGLVLLGASALSSGTAVGVAAYAGCVVAVGWVGSEAFGNGSVLLGASALSSGTAVGVAAYAGCVVAAGWVGLSGLDTCSLLTGTPFLEQSHALSGPALQSHVGLAPHALGINNRTPMEMGKIFVFPDTL